MRNIVIPVTWFIGIIAVILSGFKSDHYLEHVQNTPPPHPYPANSIFLVIFFMTIHTALIIAALRPKSYSLSWGRALTALAISLGFFYTWRYRLNARITPLEHVPALASSHHNCHYVSKSMVFNMRDS